MNFFRIVFLISISIFTFSCKTNQSISSQTITPNQFSELINTVQDKNIIDVRTPEEFETGSINNAVNINIFETDFEAQIQKLNKENPVFIYCKAGARSEDATKIFEKNGFKKIYNLKGGLMAWELAKLPIKTNSNSIQSNQSKDNTSNLDITKRENLTVEEFEGLVKSHPAVIVDFNAVWCGPCKKLAPLLDQMESKYVNKIKVIKIDIDKNKELTDYFIIMSIPFLQFYKNGKVQEQFEGLPSKANLVYQIEKLLK